MARIATKGNRDDDMTRNEVIMNPQMGSRTAKVRTYVCTVHAVYGYTGDGRDAERVLGGSMRMEAISNGAMRE